MIKVAVSTLGCPKNIVESETIISRLHNDGFTITDTLEDADVLILNTCGFIDKATEESVKTILQYSQLKRAKPLVLAVVGCLVERFKESLADQIPEVDLWLGVSDISSLGYSLRDFFPGRTSELAIPSVQVPSFGSKLTPPHYVYLRIADGCNHRCSFCVIPSIRGPYRSRSVEEITADAQYAARQGARELCVVAQDISGYGRDLSPHRSLVELLSELETIVEIRWIRLMYLYPDNVTDELIAYISRSKKVCRYLDIPFQHLNTKILKNMRRAQTRDSIYTLIKKLRDQIPGLCLRTSFIVGFPGEGPHEFDELLSGIEELKFERLGVFVYSEEKDTHAETIPGKVSAKVAQKRYHRIMSAQQKISLTINKSLVDRELIVMIDRITDDGSVFARTEWDAPEIDGTVLLKPHFSYNISPGDFATIRVTDAQEYDIEGIMI